MRNLILVVVGIFMTLAIVTLAFAKYISNRITRTTEKPRDLMFLGHQDLDQCSSCNTLLHTYENCKCGCVNREKIVVVKRTFSNGDVDFEVVGPISQFQLNNAEA